MVISLSYKIIFERLSKFLLNLEIFNENSHFQPSCILTFENSTVKKKHSISGAGLRWMLFRSVVGIFIDRENKVFRGTPF